MTDSTVDYLWLSFAKDGREHAVLTERSTPDSQGYLDAVCTKVLSASMTTRVDSPSANVCPYCFSATDDKIGDPDTREREGAPG
ncbi:hypothetical protein [Goodfellowiella coeruleoviolacea]|uniref:Uncharacterized protein n=1 Tax=Goodfellowiella coeruleoviolacea TaxID=334858 RepID=A0AAE3GCZ5_9PSEU|nr:hypothetical protein [Goodfellowiella coeruleoviolacea]MCP2164924.1 hypothetical protein [Goodfellowiella coeruleoviolacea]